MLSQMCKATQTHQLIPCSQLQAAVLCMLKWLPCYCHSMVTGHLAQGQCTSLPTSCSVILSKSFSVRWALCSRRAVGRSGEVTSSTSTAGTCRATAQSHCAVTPSPTEGAGVVQQQAASAVYPLGCQGAPVPESWTHLLDLPGRQRLLLCWPRLIVEPACLAALAAVSGTTRCCCMLDVVRSGICLAGPAGSCWCFMRALRWSGRKWFSMLDCPWQAAFQWDVADINPTSYLLLLLSGECFRHLLLQHLQGCW